MLAYVGALVEFIPYNSILIIRQYAATPDEKSYPSSTLLPYFTFL